METSTDLKRTPLYDEHVAAGARMVPFGGWSMPVHYGSQIEEHHAVRRDVGLFDVSHMGQVFVEGPQAVELVNRIVTRDITSLPDGAACYGALCREDGTLIDDLFISRFTFDRILIVVNASTYDGDVAAMKEIEARARLNAKLIPCAEKWAMIAVQGPNWKQVCLKVFGNGDWEQVEPLRIFSMTYGGHELLFSTTGYTGEAGVELICDPSVSPKLWRELIAAGGRPCGLAARDTLRLESGMNLSGQDFTATNNPFEVRMSWIVDLGKEFQGRDALAKLKETVTHRQVGLLTEGRRIPRHLARVLYNGQPVGEITSGGFSPTLDRPIAMALVATAQTKIGTELEVELGPGATTKATVVKLPFYKRAQ
ncbi:glycine cleavage system aminomethyltransferase GcvT [bacterium]|nr:glycine cleavage system aminomethyltransferase GcvT [bacterium]